MTKTRNLADLGGGFIQAGTGAVQRTVESKLQDVVSVLDFIPPGTDTANTDCTAYIQAAFDTIQFMPTTKRKSVYFPEGRYNFTQLTLPVAVFYCIYGDGSGSVLVQKGDGIKYAPLTAGDNFNHDLHATIRDLHFDGTDGTGNTLDLTYSQTTDVIDVYFTNVPENYSALVLDGNPASGVYAHDFTVSGIRIYNRYDYTKIGFAGIRLGSYLADSIITKFVMQGLNVVDYCLFADSNALTTQISDSHIFNAKKSVVRLDNNNADISFTNVVFDWSVNEDLVYIKGCSNIRFANCQFQVRNGWGVTLDNSYNTLLLESKFNPLGQPISGLVREINISGPTGGRNRVVYAVSQDSDLATTLFSLDSTTSYATGVVTTGTANANWPKQTHFGTVYALNGNTQIDQTQGTTKYLGANGLQTFSDQTNWSVPVDGYVKSALIVTNNTPAAGQTFLLELYKGNTLVGSGTISNGEYSTTIVPSTSLLASVTAGDSLYIKSTFSAASGSSYMRFNVLLTG